jgi:hypothetical protein
MAANNIFGRVTMNKKSQMLIPRNNTRTVTFVRKSVNLNFNTMEKIVIRKGSEYWTMRIEYKMVIQRSLKQ